MFPLGNHSTKKYVDFLQHPDYKVYVDCKASFLFSKMQLFGLNIKAESGLKYEME